MSLCYHFANSLPKAFQQTTCNQTDGQDINCSPKTDTFQLEHWQLNKIFIEIYQDKCLTVLSDSYIRLFQKELNQIDHYSAVPWRIQKRNCKISYRRKEDTSTHKEIRSKKLCCLTRLLRTSCSWWMLEKSFHWLNRLFS